MKVRNLINANGNAVVNQFVIEDGVNNFYFQSYDSLVAKREGRVFTLGRNF